MLRRGFKGDKPRFAYVLEKPVLDPERLGETVARNRGMDVKAFDNIEEADRWLLDASSGSIRRKGYSYPFIEPPPVKQKASKKLVPVYLDPERAF
jgi:hypothetical protein